MYPRCSIIFFFFFNDTATTEIYTLSLHDALPIWGGLAGACGDWQKALTCSALVAFLTGIARSKDGKANHACRGAHGLWCSRGIAPGRAPAARCGCAGVADPGVGQWCQSP